MELIDIVNQKSSMAKFILRETTYICKRIEKRPPGSAGEKSACEYMAKLLKNECGCEKVEIESFDEHPGAFYGWIYICFTSILAAIVTFFFIPALSAVLIALSFVLAFLEFGAYKKPVDKLFKKHQGHNVTAINKPTGETKRRLLFNGHPDAAWEWPVNYRLGGVGFESHIIISTLGALYYLVLAVLSANMNGLKPAMLTVSSPFFKPALCGLVFVPFMIGMFFMWNKHRVVDGANDNLSGCLMGIAVLKAMHDNGINLENTEVGVLLTGSEEAGLRGAKAWSKKHKDDYKDVPTFIFSYDTIHDPNHLMVNYRDLNGTVKADKDVCDLFLESAQDLDIPCKKGWVPPLGGATDSAAFSQSGFRSAGITGLNHKLESYYHTRLDSYDNMNLEGLANCFAASVGALKMFDDGAKQ